MTSLNTVSTLFGGTAPHGLKELYGESFSDGTSAPASGPINLRAFNGKSPIPTISPTYGTTYVTSTISPSPLTYTSSNTAYTINIAGPIGPQTTSTPQNDVRGIDVNSADQVTMKVYDSAYSTSSQLRFHGNYLSIVQGSVNRFENNTFNNRYEPSGGYTYIDTPNVFNAAAVVSWYIPMPNTVTKVEFYYTKSTPWAGFSITIT
jgi:hypothetical protein